MQKTNIVHLAKNSGRSLEQEGSQYPDELIEAESWGGQAGVCYKGERYFFQYHL